MAVRERSANVRRTMTALGVRVPVLYDDERIGNWNNAARAWKAVKSGATHHVVLQDDIVLCKNFLATVTRLCELRPKSPLTLFTMRKGTREAVEQGKHWVRVEYGVWGQATVLPTPLIPQMFRWIEKNVEPDFKYDDARISLWLEHHRIPAFAPAPNIVEHLDEKSVLGHHTPLSRKSRLFIGENTDGLSIDWTKGLDDPLTERLANMSQTYSKHLILEEK